MKAAAALLLLCFSLPTLAQTVSGVTRVGSEVVLTIDGVEYRALTAADFAQVRRDYAQMKGQLDAATRELAQYRDLRQSYEAMRKELEAMEDKRRAMADDLLKLGDRYSETSAKLVALNGEYRKLVADYDALVGKYRAFALRTAPRETIDLGLGLVHAADENRVVGMAGIGTRIFDVGLRSWVFGGRGTYGVMMGVSF